MTRIVLLAVLITAVNDQWKFVDDRGMALGEYLGKDVLKTLQK